MLLTRPRVLDAEDSFDVVSLELLPGRGVENLGLDTPERESGRSWLAVSTEEEV